MENKDENIKQSFSFKLRGIELISSRLNNHNIVLKDKQTFHYNIKIEQKIKLDNNFIIIAPEVEIQHEDKKTVLGFVKIACVFHADNINDFTDKENGLITLPSQITTSLNSISLSTLRGVVFSQFRGTILHNAFLPVIDPKTFENPIPQKIK
jgi:hypothetical protein